jgi:hypothetical protein
MIRKEVIENQSVAKAVARLLDVWVDKSTANFFRTFAWSTPEATARVASRQATFARLERVTAFATAIAAIGAATDDSLREWVFSPAFGRIHPYSASTYTRFEFVNQKAAAMPPFDVWEPIWNQAGHQLLEVLSTPDRMSEDGAMLVQGALACLSAGVLAYGGTVSAPWQALWDDAESQGILKASPYARMHLAMLGAFVGCSEPHIQWLESGGHRALEVADVCCFVRSDVSADLRKAQQRCAAGQVRSFRDVLHPDRPICNLVSVVKYARTCMRNPLNFNTPSLVLMPLIWVREVEQLVRELREQGASAEDLMQLEEAFTKFERVQQIEKARFWAMRDAQDSPVRGRLFEAIWYGERVPTSPD